MFCQIETRPQARRLSVVAATAATLLAAGF